ncbi:hypothetical protein [Pelagibius sp.]|uniref:hypothetical protein n=1 Tax=Pelagibius sp. TaxID=1931238 RepID=UPI003B50649B
MRERLSLRFDFSQLIEKAHQAFKKRAGEVTVSLSLPFISITASPADLERRIARELLIRLSDRRVLSGKECCDNCIDQSLESLQSIRAILVDKQVELSQLSDGSLYLLLELMLEGLRQFLTFEQRISTSQSNWEGGDHPDFHRPPGQREMYFEALETLRGHLSRCLGQIAVIADMEVPKVGAIPSYQNAWPKEVYAGPEADNLKLQE